MADGALTTEARVAERAELIDWLETYDPDVPVTAITYGKDGDVYVLRVASTHGPQAAKDMADQASIAMDAEIDSAVSEVSDDATPAAPEGDAA